MNCKPGDIAISANHGRNSGRLFEILYAPPLGCSFNLPNGVLHSRVMQSGNWVVRVIDGTIIAESTTGKSSPVNYGVADDRVLRPIKPDEVEEMATEASDSSEGTK